MSYKRGAYTVEEMDFINENGEMSDEDIAKKLNRPVNSINKLRSSIKLKNKLYLNTAQDFIDILHTRHYWVVIKQQLLNAIEERFFEQEWASLYSQFSSNTILHTDELLMKDLIITYILSNRIMIEKKSCLQDKEQLQKELEMEMYAEIGARDAGRISQLRSEINAHIANIETLAKEYTNLQSRVTTLLKDLKATRDQRLKQAEEGRTNIWVKFAHLDEYLNRKKEGRQMELVAMAGDKSEEQLSELIEYEDNTVDRPFLTPEIVEKALKEEANE